MFSCEFCEIFKNTFFYRTFPVAASVSQPIYIQIRYVDLTSKSRWVFVFVFTFWFWYCCFLICLLLLLLFQWIRMIALDVTVDTFFVNYIIGFIKDKENITSSQLLFIKAINANMIWKQCLESHGNATSVKTVRLTVIYKGIL